MLGQAASLPPLTDAMAIEPPDTAASVGEVGIVEGARTSDVVTAESAAAASTAATTTAAAAGGEATTGGALACPSASASAEPCPTPADPCPLPGDGDATCGGQGGGKRKLVTQEDAEQEHEPAEQQQQVVEEGLQVEEGRQVVQKVVVSLGGRRLVSEVGGLKLHLSKQSSTGYKGVTDYKGTFTARTSKVPKQKLGTFESAVDAAVCYARHMLAEGVEVMEEEAAGEGVEEEGVEVVEEEAEQEQAQQVVEEGVQVEGQQVVEEGLQVEEGRQVVQKVVRLGELRLVSEVDGLKLHLSKHSSTGYKGVRKSGGQTTFKVGSRTNPRP